MSACPGVNGYEDNHTCVMVNLDDHRFYCILALWSCMDGISVLHSFLAFALLSKQLFRDFPVIM